MFAGRALILVAALSSAPFQCGRAPTADSRIEETAAEALYRLAGEFRARGEVAAAKATLRHLVERYPGSREAHLAADDLARLEGAASATPR
jgi:hypothetical protein